MPFSTLLKINSESVQFLTIDEDSGVRDLRVDHLVVVVDQSELDSQVVCLSRFEDRMVDAQPGPEASRLGLVSGYRLGGYERSLGGTDLGELSRL